MGEWCLCLSSGRQILLCWAVQHLGGEVLPSPPYPIVAVGHISARSHPASLAASTAELHVFSPTHSTAVSSHGFIQQYYIALCS